MGPCAAPRIIIVTKDADFNDLSVARSSPPKVIWLLTGNCATTVVETLLRAHFADIDAFEQDPTAGTLALS